MHKLFTPFALAISLSAVAQQQVTLQIDHWLDGTPFSNSAVAANNSGQEFDAARLEYYISEISLIHDGGQETLVPGTWVLANASSMTTADLGQHSISSLEAVRFGIGVDPAVNHLDPSTYPSNHPLAPRSPSMHWGWAAGYRFVAMEGQSGAGLAQNYEIHALGDDNYFVQTIPTQGVMEGGDLIVKLNADYVQAMYSVNVASGPIVHGETGIARDLLENFRDRVFTSVEGNGPVGIEEFAHGHLTLYPNPTLGSVRVSTTGIDHADVLRVHDALGRAILDLPFNNTADMIVELPDAGMYRISILQDGVTRAVSSVVRQ